MKCFGKVKLIMLMCMVSLFLVACGQSSEETATSLQESSVEEVDSDESITMSENLTKEQVTTQENVSRVPNEVAASPGNIANSAFFGFQNDEMFYTANYDLGILNLETGELSKVKNGGGNHYVVMGDLVFQSNIMGLNRVNLSTGEILNLSNDFALNLNYDGQWLYYVNDKEDKLIYKIRPDGSERTQISDLDNVSIMILYKGKLYFNRYWNSHELYSMETDGSNLNMLDDQWIDFFIIENDMIYAMQEDDPGLYKYNLDGSGKAKLTDQYGSFMNVCQGYLFYPNDLDGNNMYKMNLSDYSTEKVLDFPVNYTFSHGDYLYFYNVQDYESKIYRMAYDSNTPEVMNMPSDIE